MAKKKEEKPEEAESKEENIVEEEKAEEKTEEKDYNSIFDDDYVEEEEKPKEEVEEAEEESVVAEEVAIPEEEETAAEEEPGESSDSSSDSSSNKKNKKDKSDTSKKEDNKEEKEPDKKSDEKKNEEAFLDKPAKDKKGSTKKKILIALAVLLALLLGAFGGYLYFKGSNKPKEEPAPTKTEEPQKTETKKEVYVTADGGLNMREKPDKNAKVLILIPTGTKLTVLEEQNGWYKVEYNGKTGWVSKDFVSETKPEWKTYSGSGFSTDNPKFSINYPFDWTLNGYKVSKTDSGKTYTISLGEGGHGFSEGDASITSTQEDITVNGQAGIKTTAKKDGKIVLLVASFQKGNGNIGIEFSPPEGYDQSYIDIYDKMIQTFKFL